MLLNHSPFPDVKFFRNMRYYLFILVTFCLFGAQFGKEIRRQHGHIWTSDFQTFDQTIWTVSTTTS